MTSPLRSLDISVLMPVYIREPTRKIIDLLDRAVESVAEQKYPGEAEILIVDDGSSTPVQELLAGHERRIPLRFVRYVRNNGLVYALNAGLNAARYGLIARMDADDCWAAHKIEQQIDRLVADPDLTVVGTGMRRVFEDGSPTEDHIRPDGWSPLLKFFVDCGCPFPHASILARSDIYRLLGGYSHSERVSHCEDYALWGIWLRFFKPAMIELPLHIYTVSADSVSSRHLAQQQKATGRINSAFASLRVVDTVPDEMSSLADILGISLLQAGVLCYRLWHLKIATCLPEAALAPLQKMLTDRDVASSPSGGIVAVSRILGAFGSVEDRGGVPIQVRPRLT
ncbi:Glycosyl transferase family 2 [Tardiphaga sp. OK246]|uniref:glycosyltransferase n=1 Tax=Tardiphaga sp. OK246 TaxID=1855307 RepID=UPI000B7358ED|nr:glycosyltransferase [Tardiphaga sp. OK246]SNT63960.1 Glycosyl transferase family 2 [Tardiphaga sp. OK246]